jgi:hypothetical protein
MDGDKPRVSPNGSSKYGRGRTTSGIGSSVSSAISGGSTAAN